MNQRPLPPQGRPKQALDGVFTSGREVVENIEKVKGSCQKKGQLLFILLENIEIAFLDGTIFYIEKYTSISLFTSFLSNRNQKLVEKIPL